MGMMCLSRAPPDQRRLHVLCFPLSILHTLPCDTVAVVLPSHIQRLLSIISYLSLITSDLLLSHVAFPNLA